MAGLIVVSEAALSPLWLFAPAALFTSTLIELGSVWHMDDGMFEPAQHPMKSSRDSVQQVEILNGPKACLTSTSNCYTELKLSQLLYSGNVTKSQLKIMKNKTKPLWQNSLVTHFLERVNPLLGIDNPAKSVTSHACTVRNKWHYAPMP